MGKKRLVIVIFLLTLLLCLLAGCGEKEYVVEYGVDSYVYPARLLKSMDGVDNLRIVGDYLYYTQTADNTVIKRVSVADMVSGKGSLDFSEQETRASFSCNIFLLPEGTAENIEDIDFLSLLDNSGSGKYWTMEEGKRYGSFSLAGYAADLEGNLYYYLSASIYRDFNIENGGGILGKQTADGQQVYRMHFPEMAGIALNGDGMLFVLSGEKILILDQEGGQAGAISAAGYYSGEKKPREELFTDSEGRVYYSIVNEQYVRRTYEIEEGTFRLKDAGEILGSGLMNASASSSGNVFLYSPSSESVLYEYNRETNSSEKILNWYDSGLMSYGIQSVVRITPDILLVNYEAAEGNGIYQLTRTPVEELPDKELLVIASPGGSFELQRAVMMFNIQSDAYRVILDSYGCEYSHADKRWTTTRLDASLASANPPDILNLESLNLVKYAEKGVLADLTPYIESSNELEPEDIPENLLEGMTFDGRIVCLPLSFSIYNIGGRSSQIGEMKSWTMDDVYRLSELHPESIGQLVADEYGGRKQREWLLEEFCAHYYLEEFVDWEEGECYFDSEEFRTLLAWAGTYGCEPEREEAQTGTVFLNLEYIPENSLLVSQFTVQFNTLMKLSLQFGEEACLTGYPSTDGKGYFPAKIEGTLGIVDNSAHKDAAWEFLEYYRKINSSVYNLNASKMQITEKYEDITTLETYAEPNGETKEATKGYISFQGTETKYSVIPKDQADAILEVIQTADFTPLSEEEEMIIQIVIEEAASYYNGDKSLEEVTAIIQNRAGLVLKERK